MSMDAYRALIAQLKITGETGDFRTSDLYKAMIGRSLEACMGTIGALAEACAADDAVSAETARSVGDARVFAPPTGSAKHRALAIEMPARGYVAVMEFDDPAGDDLSMVSLHRLTTRCGEGLTEEIFEREKAKLAPEVEQVTVYRTYAPFPGWTPPPTDMDGAARLVALRKECADAYRPTLAQTLKAAVKDTWTGNKLFGAGQSWPPMRAGKTEWRDGRHDLSDIEEWTRFFPALHAAIQAFGLTERFQADAMAFAERRFSAMKGFDEFELAQQAGDTLARLDGYLPRAAAVEGARLLWAMAAENGMDKMLEALRVIHAQCLAHGHTNADSAFDHNDLDNFVHAPASGRDDLDLLVFRDQNVRLLVALPKDADGAVTGVEVHRFGDSLEEWFAEHFAEGITSTALADAASRRDDYASPYLVPRVPSYAEALAAATGASDGPAPLVRFTVGPEGAVAPAGMAIDGSSIRGWNSLVCDIETAECCLDDEYGALATPAGPAR